MSARFCPRYRISLQGEILKRGPSSRELPRRSAIFGPRSRILLWGEILKHEPNFADLFRAFQLHVLNGFHYNFYEMCHR